MGKCDLSHRFLMKSAMKIGSRYIGNHLVSDAELLETLSVAWVVKSGLERDPVEGYVRVNIIRSCAVIDLKHMGIDVEVVGWLAGWLALAREGSPARHF